MGRICDPRDLGFGPLMDLGAKFRRMAEEEHMYRSTKGECTACNELKGKKCLLHYICISPHHVYLLKNNDSEKKAEEGKQ